MCELPPGQIAIQKLSVVGESAASADAPYDNWLIEICGKVTRPRTYLLSEIRSMKQQSFRMDVHCVTGWTRLATEFVGIPLSVLLESAAPQASASLVRFEAYSDRHHDTSLPLDVALENCWVVHSVDGRALSPEHGGPLRVVTQKRYFYKSLKWLRRIELLSENHLGYWERESAYHNNADPLLEQRFDPERVASAEVIKRFREASDFDAFRSGSPEDVVIGARFSNWSAVDEGYAAIAAEIVHV